MLHVSGAAAASAAARFLFKLLALEFRRLMNYVLGTIDYLGATFVSPLFSLRTALNWMVAD